MKGRALKRFNHKFKEGALGRFMKFMNFFNSEVFGGHRSLAFEGNVGKSSVV